MILTRRFAFRCDTRHTIFLIGNKINLIRLFSQKVIAGGIRFIWFGILFRCFPPDNYRDLPAPGSGKIDPEKNARCPVKLKTSRTASLFLSESQQLIAKHNLPHIVECLQQLSEDEIWWRPNPASNSAGNLVLHLCGNVRQWIISGLGGVEDRRERDREFAERGPLPRQALVTQLRRTVRDACRVLAKLSDDSLARKYDIQGYHASGMAAAYHVVEHFSYHTGQIIYITKLKRAQDLKFTRLPVMKKHGSR
jgi:uncharacterized damage-inducible protein DinB